MTKKKVWIIVLIVCLVLLLAAGVVLAVIFWDKDPKKEYVENTYTYDEAMKILDSGDREAGIAALRTVKGEEGAAKRKEIYLSLFGEEFYHKIHNAKVGDVITFGSFEQDDNDSNGKEDVEWLVLAEEKEGKLLLITKYAIECVRYNKKAVPITWEESYIRSWLNDGFLSNCFTQEQRWIIPTTYVENKDNPLYGTDGGNDTWDQVFLLSIDEAEEYFEDNFARMTSATEVAKIHYAYADPFNNTAWWLRSPSFESDKAAIIADTGEIYRGAHHRVTELYISTRPALWIDLS